MGRAGLRGRRLAGEEEFRASDACVFRRSFVDILLLLLRPLKGVRFHFIYMMVVWL